MIPSNITCIHVVKAIQQIQASSIPSQRQSTKHDLVYQGQRFPPKLVLSIANEFVNGEPLPANRFSGGKESNTYLSNLGFEIIAKEIGKRNPPWQRDELILALDLYFRHPPGSISQDHPEVVKLSEVLNQLPIHQNRPDEDRFRNSNSVYMKLCHFLRFDSTYAGKGVTSGGKAEEEIWTQFSTDRERLRRLAAQIIDSVKKGEAHAANPQAVDSEEAEFPEGKVLYRLHRTRERNRTLTEKAKEKRRQETSSLDCEVCGFNFIKAYGEVGRDYIECHHTKPVSELEVDGKTKIKDLALVCANCHRMLHRKRPWLSINQLKSLLVEQQRSELFNL